MAPKRKAPATSTSSTTTSKKTTRSSTKKQVPPPPSSDSSDQESDDPPPVKKKKSSTTSTTTTKAKPKPKAKASPVTKIPPVKGKGKKKQEEIIISDDSDDQSESDEEVVKPVKKGKGKAKKVEPVVEKKKKGKSKAKVEYTSELEQESEDDDVVIMEPKSKKKVNDKVKKTSTTTSKSKSKLKANSPPSTPSEHTPIPSTSKPSKSKSSKPKKAISPPPKPVPFGEALKKWFEPFAEKGEDAEEGMMGGEGIEKLFEEMGLSMEGVYPFLLAWDLKAKPGTFGSFAYNDFESTLRPLNIRTSSELSAHLTQLESTLYPSSPASPSAIDIFSPPQPSFSSFYSFLFPFLLPDGSKSLPPSLALPVLSVVLAPKYKSGKEFVEYAEGLGEGFKSVSTDTWGMLLEFIETVGEDFEGWSEMDAWPSTIDNFVGWKQEKDEREKMDNTA